MTLKERYNQRKSENLISEFKEILEFISKKVDEYHPIVIELNDKKDIVVNDVKEEQSYSFDSKVFKNIFNFNSEDGIRDFKNEFLYYIYMKTNNLYIRTELLPENQICILY